MVISSQLTDEQLRKEIYKLRRVLRPDIREVRAAAKTSPDIPTDAVTQMAKLETAMRKTAVRKMTRKELNTTWRQLSYIRGLKSSKLEGAQEMTQSFQPFRERMSNLSKDYQDVVWKAFNRFYNYAGQTIAEQFKYEIFLSNLTQVVRLEETEKKEREKEIEEVAGSLGALLSKATEDLELGLNKEDEDFEVKKRRRFKKRIEKYFDSLLPKAKLEEKSNEDKPKISLSKKLK